VHFNVYPVVMPLRVSDVAEGSGVSADTVRYYEREGLLPPAPRSPSGYREYDSSTTRRIHFIKGAQGFGLKLSEIRELLEIQDKGACPCGHTKALLERRVAEIEEELTRLSQLRQQLSEMADLECPANRNGDLWPCEIEFVKRGGDS
jgi:DNA-binding transcriptional MerR regulator